MTRKNKKCDITKEDIAAVYKAIREDKPDDIGITADVLKAAGNLKWPAGRFKNVYDTGCAGVQSVW